VTARIWLLLVDEHLIGLEQLEGLSIQAFLENRRVEIISLPLVVTCLRLIELTVLREGEEVQLAQQWSQPLCYQQQALILRSSQLLLLILPLQLQ
jgi:hypothetical protein